MLVVDLRVTWGAAPVAGDLLGTGKVNLVTATREGYLMAWRTPGSPAGLEWREEGSIFIV